MQMADVIMSKTESMCYIRFYNTKAQALQT